MIVVPRRVEYYTLDPAVPPAPPARSAPRPPMEKPAMSDMDTPATMPKPTYTPSQAQRRVHNALGTTASAEKPPPPPPVAKAYTPPPIQTPILSPVATRLHAEAVAALEALAEHSGRVDPSADSISLGVAMTPEVRRALALPPTVGATTARPVQLHTPGTGASAGDAWPIVLPEGAVCAWDLHPFTWAPIGEVIRWDEARRRAILRDYFCSFGCARAFIKNQGGRRPDTSARLGRLNTMARDVYGIDHHHINTAPPRQMIYKLGITEFRRHIGERSYAYIPDMYVGLCRLVLEEPTRYKTITQMEALLETSGNNGHPTISDSADTASFGQTHTYRPAVDVSTRASAPHATSYGAHRGMSSFVNHRRAK